MKWWHRIRGHRIVSSTPHVRTWDTDWNMLDIVQQGTQTCSCSKVWQVPRPGG